MCACMRACVCVCIHMHACLCVFVCMCMCACTYACAFVLWGRIKMKSLNMQKMDGLRIIIPNKATQSQKEEKPCMFCLIQNIAVDM